MQEFWGHGMASLHFYSTAQLSKWGPNCHSSRDEFQGGDMRINGTQLSLQFYYLPSGRLLLPFSTFFSVQFLLTSRVRGWFLFHKLKFHFVAFLFKISVFLIFYWDLYLLLSCIPPSSSKNLHENMTFLIRRVWGSLCEWPEVSSWCIFCSVEFSWLTSVWPLVVVPSACWPRMLYRSNL